MAGAIKPYQRKKEASIIRVGAVGATGEGRKVMVICERCARAMRMRWFLGGLVGLLMLGGLSANAEKWSRRYIRRLPDPAFAAIETTAEGKKLRHLPHHDAQGKLDVPHLCNALARVGQVKWRDPARAEDARRHLRDHLEQAGRKPCRPSRKSGR